MSKNEDECRAIGLNIINLLRKDEECSDENLVDPNLSLLDLGLQPRELLIITEELLELDLTLEKENALRVDHPRTVKDYCDILVKRYH
ncbi:MAG: hypothetical protein ACLFNN_02000 [Candidatus Paceibacterota bacterium]